MQLPAGAQTWLSCGFDNAWTATEYLTAHVVDSLRVANWQRVGDARAPQPEPVRRPSDIRNDKRDGAATAERRSAKARAFIERQRRRQSIE